MNAWNKKYASLQLPLGGDAWYWLGQSPREDPLLGTVLDWLKAQKQTDLKALLVEHSSSEEGNLILCNDRILWFIRDLVPMVNVQRWNWRSPALHGLQAHHVTALNGATKMGGHQGHDHTFLCCGTFLVAKNDQPGAAVHEILHTLLVTWRQPT